jgi:hypothetical protein
MACGGTASHAPKSAPEVGGAAGEPSGAAGTAPSAAAAGGSGNGGVGGAGGAEAEVAGEAGAAGVEAGAAGAAGQPSSCVGLECLAGAELIYVPDRAWQRPAGAVNMSSELAEADYQPLLGPTLRAKFSSDAQSLDLTPTAGGDTVHGTRDATRTDRAWFDLTLFAGGRFVVQVNANELQAEYTAYGSGTPIVSSTRGLLENP